MPQPRQAVVTQSVRITPTMQRVFLGGEDLRSFPAVTAGAYVKLMFDKNGNPLNEPTDMGQVAMRTYTSAKPGDVITLAGPGSSKGLSEHYDWVLLAGDMTALPSIRNHLAALPSHAKGYAVIRIEDEKDAVVLKKPEDIEVIWEFEDTLSNRLSQLNWLEGTPAVWVACEFSDMRTIRTWLKDDKAIAHNNIYISSYWKKGRSEDQHKIEKRQDSEAFAKTLA